MASLEKFDDLVVRDVGHRNQFQFAPSGNTIQHLYSHTANLSAATLVGSDGWSLLIRTTDSRLQANAISTANSIFSVNSADTSLHGNVQVVGSSQVEMVSANVAKFGACVLDGVVSGQGVSSIVSSELSAVTTSGAVFDALQTQSDYPTITTLGTLTSLQVHGNVTTANGTLGVLGTVRVFGEPSDQLYSVTRPWTNRTGSITREWNNVGFGNGLFVAVGGTAIDGTGGIMTSPDGNSWTTRATNITTEFRSVCFGGGRFVAVTDASNFAVHFMTSVDGINWTTGTVSAQNAWNSVVFGNGIFVAVAWTGEGNRVMTSTNGTTWTSRQSPADNNWQSVAFGDGVFVAVADNDDGFDTRRVMTSPDGIVWTLHESADDLASWNSVTYGNGLFVAVAHDQIMTSPNGINWTLQQSPAPHPWWSVAFGNGLFVAVAWEGVGGRAMSSPDGVVWRVNSSAAADSGWYSVAFGAGKFVALAIQGDVRVMTWDVSPINEPLLSVSGNMVVGGGMNTGPLRVINMLRAGNVAIDVPDISWISARVSSSSNAIVFDAQSYTHTGSSLNSLGGLSKGRTRHLSYVMSPALPIGSQSRREYGMSQRFWSGKVSKTNGSLVVNCHGNSAYPLYGNYTVQYTTKAGTFDYKIANCFRGSTALQGNTGALTWRDLSSVSSSTAGLSAVLGFSTWLPTITFTNTTSFHAFFQIRAVVFDESFAFSEAGV